MWDRLFTPELVEWMVQVTDGSESYDTVSSFIKAVKNRVEYEAVVGMSFKWDEIDTIKQANIAVSMAGLFHASRFILMMDYLNLKHKESKKNG